MASMALGDGCAGFSVEGLAVQCLLTPMQWIPTLTLALVWEGQLALSTQSLPLKAFGCCSHLEGPEDGGVVAADLGLLLGHGLLVRGDDLAQLPDGFLHLLHRRRRQVQQAVALLYEPAQHVSDPVSSWNDLSNDLVQLVDECIISATAGAACTAAFNASAQAKSSSFGCLGMPCQRLQSRAWPCCIHICTGAGRSLLTAMQYAVF